ncbi:response regulator [Pedobacter petrophilus]|uniref:histidine kinase n=1 Tax=Pedobacter petrophilus TaxID=1908241 RepID=A0A7K0G595_9SPHI|nr:hybrid sensor histidine kinase/response regulator transcription factor [Pedobacter petrophilus]MRX78802.1 response regulator [Pedobacter petrophilus]
MKKLLISMLLFLMIHASAFSQSYTFRHYQVENGLSYNSVICSIQDRKGFLWFGTKDGLNRFDGYIFKTFRNNPDDPKSLGSNFIHALYEDQTQHIWVGTLSGLYKYNSATESFDFIKATKNEDIRDVRLDEQGNVWYIAGLLLCKYNQKTKKLTKFEHRIHPGATSISITPTGDLWVSTNDGFIQMYNKMGNNFESYSVFDKSQPTISGWIEKLYDTGKGYFLIGTSNQGVKVFDQKSLTYKDLNIKNPDRTALYARSFLEKNRDEYWIATESGLFSYNMITGGYSNLRHEFNNPYSMSDNAVYTLTKDKEGGVWAGTYFGGINYHSNQPVVFDKYFPKEGAGNLSGHAVREICNDLKGNIWIGTEDGGLNKLIPTANLFKHFKPTGDNTGIAHTNIHGLMAAGNELWVGTFERGLDVIDINTGKVIRHYSAGPGNNEMKSNFVESLLKTKSGILLIGTSNGLYRYNRSADKFNVVSEVPVDIHYSSLLEDNKGTIWAASLRTGLYFYDPISNTSGSFTTDEQNKNSISSNAVNSVFIDSKGSLWVSTENGLNKIDRKNNKIRRYFSKDGFPSDVFYKILEDEHQNLWISTSRGLACFNPKNENIKTYTKENGLLSDQFNYSSAFKDQDGKMYFGSLKGMISFSPDQFSINRFLSPVYITGFQVFNKELEINRENSVLSKSITFTKAIRLPHDQSTFSIDFAALGYTSPETTEYRYMMEGLDKNWVYLKRNRKVYFTNLSPGTYTFKIRASNGFGKWNQDSTEMVIFIDPPIWASGYVLFIYSLALILIFYLTIRYYRRRLIDKQVRVSELWESNKQKELYNSKLEFFTYVTHEIRTPLTLIKGPLEDVIKNSQEMPSIKDSLVTVRKNTDRLLELTDQLLDFRKTETKGFSLNMVTVNINQLLEENCIRYKSEMATKNIELNIKFPQPTFLTIADPEALNKMLSNLIDNAVKYAKNKIFMEVILHDQVFEIGIKSDGELIPDDLHEKIFEPFYRLEYNKDQRGTGIGLPLARSLAELHQGTLRLSIAEGHYNLFSLMLPRRDQDVTIAGKNPTEPETEETEDSQQQKPVILLVEDNVEIREFITAKICKKFQVLEVGNGADALDLIQQRSIHLIVSDVMMPIMDGYTLCNSVKNNLEYAHIPVILLTAKSTLQSKIEGLESGADAYIEKPFSPDHLLTQIQSLLASREKIKKYFATSPLAHLKSMAYNKSDEVFLDRLNKIILENISNKSLDVELLAGLMNMTRPTFYRKIKAIANLSPHELITITRLKEAAELLVVENFKIMKIASMTGFGSQAQFTRSFTKQFGMSPTEYINSMKPTRAKSE